MTTQPQRSSDSYLNLSLNLTGGLSDKLVNWNNRLHLSNHKRDVELTKPKDDTITSDIIDENFYRTLNAKHGTVWALNHSALTQSTEGAMTLSGSFDIIARCPQAATQREFYFALYQQCSDHLMANKKLAERFIIDWLLQPTAIVEGGEGSENVENVQSSDDAENVKRNRDSGYILRCCIESVDSADHKTLVKRMHQLTILLAECLSVD